MTTETYTKKEIYEAIIKTMIDGEIPIEPDIIIELCEREIGHIERKAMKAKEAAAKKKAEGDPLREAVYEALTTDYATIGDITMDMVEDYPEITPSKVGYRLRILVDEGLVDKKRISVPDGNKTRNLMAYARVEE